MQPAIVNEKVWEQGQELRANKRRPAKQAGRQGVSPGLLPDKSSGHYRQKIQSLWSFVRELKQDEDKQTVEGQRKSGTA